MDVDFLSENKSSEFRPTNGVRSKTPRRMRYEAEVQMIRNRFGNLDEFRAQLGLSRRAICNLLLVDPSAWTRWTASSGKAPPHIFRALEWYWYLMQKDPKAVLPIGTWGAQAYGERIRKVESELEKLSDAKPLKRSAGLLYSIYFAGVGSGVLLWVLVQSFLGR